MSDLPAYKPTAAELTGMAYMNFADVFFTDPRTVEQWFGNVCDVLDRLIAGRRSQRETDLEKRIKRFDQIIERLLDDNRIDIHERAFLSQTVEEVIDVANSAYTAEITEAEIAAFCMLAESGYEMFIEHDQDPNFFISKQQLDLAKQMRQNFPAYVETLQAIRMHR